MRMEYWRSWFDEYCQNAADVNNQHRKLLNLIKDRGFMRDMTGPQLSKWRSDHDLVLREVVDLLGGQVNHTTVSRWERQPEDIPAWASEKLLATTQITLPLDELHQLLDAAREDNTPAQQLIAQAIIAYLEKRRLTKSTETPSEVPTEPKKLLYYTPDPPVHDYKVAEDPVNRAIAQIAAQIQHPTDPGQGKKA